MDHLKKIKLPYTKLRGQDAFVSFFMMDIPLFFVKNKTSHSMYSKANLHISLYIKLYYVTGIIYYYIFMFIKHNAESCFMCGPKNL